MFHLFSSSLTLYQRRNRGGQSLVLTADDSSLADNGIWNDEASSIQVTGPCQWILYTDANYADSSSSSVVGPGTRDYEAGYGTNRFGIPNDALTSVRCLPAYNTTSLVLFQHHYYRGRMLVLSRSNPDLADVSFDNDVTSVIITGGTWQLHSRFNYQGSTITLGQGHYPTAYSLYPIANDDLSSVRFVGKSYKFMQGTIPQSHTTSNACIKSQYKVTICKKSFFKLPSYFVLLSCNFR